MSCQRSPPASPRAPKIQQESWDDCGSPPIDLFDPSQLNSPRSPSIRNQVPSKNPKSPRKFNKPINVGYYEPRSPVSSRSFNYNNNQRSPKYENPPRSPKITTTYANDDDDDDDNDGNNDDGNDCSPPSFYQSPPGTRSPKPSSTTAYYYENHQSPRRSPKSPRKFVFDAISPTYEQKGKKFEYYEPMTSDDDEEGGRRMIGYAESHHQQHHHHTHPQQQQHQNHHPTSHQAQHKGRGSSKNFKSSHHSHSPPDIGSRTNESNRNEKKEFSIVEVQQKMVTTTTTLQFKPERHHLDEFAPTGSRGSLFMKRDSCMTESTQLSGDSCETNATTITSTTTFRSTTSIEEPGNGPMASNSALSILAGSGGGGGGGGSGGNKGCESGPIVLPNCIPGNGKNGGKGPSGRRDERGRRHAINITSNPGYQQVIHKHSSHITLDRTCSDSVVSLRCRKSTSDLTDVRDGATPIVAKPRRRGSSKGGLAYLASRRSSRESIKSACSNASIFSNEDIGPLAFQSSTRGRQRRTSNFLELPVPDHIRPRVCSLPDRPYNPRASDDLYRLRHFSISKGTVVNCGDSIISRRSRSNTSVNSTTSRASERSPFEGSCCGGGYANVDSMPPSPTDSEPPPPPRYRIVMLGDAGVGKTALVSQFMTSEYMHTYDASLDDEFGEKTVSVLLDDEESELVFIDHPSVEMSVENSLSTYEPHACVLVYSVVDRNSFRIAEEVMNYLWKENVTKEKSVIVVGNKADLARSRVITTAEGKALAASRDAKFIETSSGIQHNVDELLVGTLKQMRLKEKRDKKAALVSTKMKNSRTHMSLHLAKEILQKICLSDITKSKSCENLHVL